MLKKIQKTLFYLLVIYGIFGFFILPHILKSQITEIFKTKTDAKITINSIYFNPFVFNLELSSIEIKTNDKKPIFSLKSLNLDFELYSLLNSAIHIKRVILKEPKIYMVLNKDKSINLAKIIKPTTNTPADTNNSQSTKIPRIILEKIAIENGMLDYKDFTQKSEFDFTFSHIGFELKNLDTKNIDTKNANIRFYSTLGDGGFIDLKSKINRLEPLSLSGSLNFEASKLYTQWRYLKDSLNLEVADGKITFYTDYALDLKDINNTTIKNLSVSLNNLRIKPKHKYKDVLNLSSLEVKRATVKPFLQNVNIEDIVLDTLYVKAKRDTKGNIDWFHYIKTNSTAKKENKNTTKDEQPSKPWDVEIKNIALKNIKADFRDNFVKPSVDTKLNKLNIYLKDVTLAGKTPLKYKLDTTLNNTFECISKGTLKHKNLLLKSYTKCNGFDLTHYNPYIEQITKENTKLFDLKLKSTIIDFDANATLFDKQILADANITLRKFKLDKKSTKEKLLTFKNLTLKHITLNSGKKTLNIQDTTLKNLETDIRRLKNEKLNIEDLILSKPTKQKNTKSPKQKTKPYEVTLNHISLRSAKLNFTDETLKPKVKNTIDKINFDAYNITSTKKHPIKYNLAMKINNSSSFKAKGKLSIEPLKQDGSFELKKLSLKDINPYIHQKAFINIDDGFLTLKGKTNYSPNNNSADLKLLGSLKLESFFLSDLRDKTPLLSLSNVYINPFTYEMNPNRLFMDEISVDSFYVNAIIDKHKNMNFASLVKPSKEQKTTQNDTNKTKEPFPIKIMKLKVKSGSAKFADLSLPIEFRTDIHDVNGVIYAISNQKDETSFVDIKGEVDKYGLTKLKGSINTGDPKKYTDLDFTFRNLELNSISGYSATFAGYKINKGKLYLDLGYDIMDSQLKGKNNIIIKNIELGDEIEDENTTSLPLGFVIALLEDSDGIIDIDMPVEGNVDEPDFKYGKLIWKTFANLIVKAVTSPFKFLGSMMGIDGEKLESIEFEAGQTNLLPPEREKLDTIAKMMIKRPKITLSISAKYDEISDKKELQKQKLISAVMKKSGLKNTDSQENIMNIKLLEEIYTEKKGTKELEKIKQKIKQNSKKEMFEQNYLHALVDKSIEIQPFSNAELERLSKLRTTTILNYLKDEKNIDTSRIKALKESNTEEHDKKSVKTKLKIIVP